MKRFIKYITIPITTLVLYAIWKGFGVNTRVASRHGVTTTTVYSPASSNVISNDTTEPLKLIEYKEWKAFKALWKSIDQHVSSSLSDKQAEVLSYELDRTSRELEKIPLEVLGQTERDFLVKLAKGIIQNLGPKFDMRLTRMAGPFVELPHWEQRSRSLQQIEKNIAAIIRLKGENKLDSAEVTIAMENLHSEILNFGHIDLLAYLISSSHGDMPKTEIIMSDIRPAYSDYKKREEKLSPGEKEYYTQIDKKYGELFKEMDQMEASQDSIFRLIDELER